MKPHLFWLLVPVLCVAQPFTEQTMQAGLSFTTANNVDITPLSFMQAAGGVGDFNRDGWPDLFVLGGGGKPDALFINTGDGHFENRASAWGWTLTHRGSGIAVGDFNNDGWPDAYITSLGPSAQPPSTGKHILLKNMQGNGFVDVAQAAGVHVASSIQADGFGSCWGDYDLDGDLDLVVTSWLLDPLGNRLFRNNADGTFDDVTAAASVFDTPVHGFSPRLVDMNGDRYPELLVAADFGTSRYYRNNGDGSFDDLTVEAGCGQDSNGMGHAVADMDRNGQPDWYVTSIFVPGQPTGNGNFLYLNQGEHSFSIAPPNGVIADGGWAWGTQAIDLNHNGLFDLLVNNGWTDNYSGDNVRLFWQTSLLTFQESAQAAGFNYREQGRGLVTLDHDRDGDMDVVLFGNDGPIALYRNNEADPNRHWIQLSLRSWYHPDCAPRGIGSRVEVATDQGTFYGHMDGGSHYLGNSQDVIHIGLGAVSPVPTMTITWPDGTMQQGTVPVDSLLTAYAPHANLMAVESEIWHNNTRPGCRGQTVDVLHLVQLLADGFDCGFLAQSPIGP